MNRLSWLVGDMLSLWAQIRAMCCSFTLRCFFWLPAGFGVVLQIAAWDKLLTNWTLDDQGLLAAVGRRLIRGCSDIGLMRSLAMLVERNLHPKGLATLWALQGWSFWMALPCLGSLWHGQVLKPLYVTERFVGKGVHFIIGGGFQGINFIL